MAKLERRRTRGHASCGGRLLAAFSSAARAASPAAFLAAFLMASSAQSAGAGLALRVEGPDRAPVVDAVVSLVPIGADGATLPGPARIGAARATMDQVGLAFVPHVLAVAVGTVVDFPNSDQVRHSIYSFSAAQTFEVKLYRGFEAPPITFDRAGIVVLGCNIHDHMVGYVYVLEAPHFGVSDEAGAIALGELPPGRYRLELRHPRLEESVVLTREVEVPGDSALVLTLGATPPPRPGSRPDVDPLQSLFGGPAR
ncbi:MAG: methylamine utilization protein [Deltaproteobacteria bacterium]|nr:methylamine utilization protein [Deltaproteobacteria bacterium]